MTTQKQIRQPTLFVGEPEQPAVTAHRDLARGLCPVCGRPSRAGVPCGWHKSGAPRGKREAQAAEEANKP